MKTLRLAVVGGINMDILGCPTGPFSLKDSSIGHVSFRAGGVGRNIAAEAAKLSASVSLITAFGGDSTGQALKNACKRDWLDISHSLQTKLPSSVYMAIHDDKGDMVAGINDMALAEAITPEALQPHLCYINAAQGCVLDANLPENTLRFLASNVTAPILCDPVSCQKSERVLPILSHLTAIKPNLIEAQAMTGEETAENASRWLLERGVRRVFISMGQRGVYYADKDGTTGTLVPSSVSFEPQTGAGDAMSAGIAIALCRGLDTKACAQAGMDAAHRHLTSASIKL